ncbi:MucR family transcriptional regulator [Solidesulfovibrio magneticus]|uniref:ROS/MUCR transcriptional regulator protein n=1 Tax=Solidesulfovibrio magneticus (strain ATCC 700980 / DSM 13731 / RS-1) TaxID=573370 RepID=C4XTQ8_SOLM1|nr:MucR family transcriptional regulator [Solidesulfovibrio magneticus]BAH73573.1 hypothetical protein DMR_00820 [Solidesulfovibrio magneticus RS-1]
MFNKKLWSEAVDIAKDQARHGKVHYSDLQKATETIYNDLLLLEQGPVFETNPIPEPSTQAALPAPSAGIFKHERVGDFVTCAECGEQMKSISIAHLKKHGINSREEYMQKHGVLKKDMIGNIKREVLKGEENPLTVLGHIMREYKVARDDVNEFIAEHGFTDLKDLMKKAKVAGVLPFEFFQDKQARNLL